MRIAIAFLLLLFCISCADTPEQQAVNLAEELAATSIADSKNDQERLESALDQNWAVSNVKTSKIKSEITVIGETEPGIYELQVEVLCTVTFKIGRSQLRERDCGDTTRYLIDIETGEIVQ